jgi:hypothetical protein
VKRCGTSVKKNWAKLSPAKESPNVLFGKTQPPPAWDCFGKDASALALFLRCAPQLTTEIWQSDVLNFFDFTEAFMAAFLT